MSPLAPTIHALHRRRYSYRASKTALNQLTKTMAVEFQRRRQEVACLLLHPGTVDTDLSAPFQKVPLSSPNSRVNDAVGLPKHTI